MSATRSFAKRYFTSWVSLTAIGVLAVGLAVAWISTDMHDSKSVDAYLQSLSTGLIGIALTVWLVNFLLDFQSHRLSSELRASTEIVAFSSLQHCIRRLPQLLPQVEAPDGVHLPQIERMQNEIDQVRAHCDSIIPGLTDPELQELLNDFKLRQFDWNEAMATLVPMIHTAAPAYERGPVFTLLRGRTESLLRSAGALADALSNRHGHEKTILGLARN